MGFNVALLVMLAAVAGAGTGCWFYYRRTQVLRRRLSDANRELEQLQRTFNRFAPARVVDDILEKRSLDIAETREVTILFADLRGFTAMSEQMEAPDLVALLNKYFQRMDRAVDKHSGFISKFIGDGLLVLFGALHHNPWQSTDAVKAALDMQRQVEALNESLDRPNLPDLSLSVGIHRGPVVAGIVGSFEVKEFTVVGRHVNLASRVEGLTREHGVDILITDAVREELDPSIALERQPAKPVKGVKEPVATYSVQEEGTEGDTQ
jgi:class 3 adenylate cyclase